MAKKRDEFQNNYKWYVKDLYENDDACIKDLEYIKKISDDLDKYKNNIMSSSKNLLELLELDTKISKKLERAYIYAHINNDADTLNSKYQELYGLAKNVYSIYLEKSSYIVPELLKSDYKLVEKYYKEEPKLKDYEIFLKEIFRNKEHVLDSEIEKVISSFSKTMSVPEEVMSSLTDSDFKFSPVTVNGKRKELTESNFSLFLKNPSQKVRELAFKSIYKTYSNFKTTLATTLKGEVEKNITISKLRKFNSSLEKSLFANEIDKKVYLNLIESVHNNLDAIYEYWGLKKKILNLEKFHIYDTYASVIKNNNKKYTFEDAEKLILKIVKPLGETYLNDIKKSFTDHWIDSCNNEGKRGGAYCTACYDVHPYVLMSFEGELNDVSTLAHELGHAMHYYYACKYQKYQDYNYSIFVAEVASQVNEILLCRYLLDNSNDDKEKLLIVDDLLQKFKSTIYRQTMFAEFELFIHEFSEKGNVLTSENMCQKYLELNKLYFGKNVIVDKEIQYEWERIPHFYMNFYVWEYATGFAAAVKLANDIYDGNTVVRDNYLEFLKLGSTKNPIDSLKVAGVDMTSNEVIDESIDFMRKLLKEYKLLQGSELNE